MKKEEIMKKVLIAVDDTAHSNAVLTSYYRLPKEPEEVVLLHIENPGGRSLMYEMLGEAEMSTLKEMIQDTDYKEKMDSGSDRLLSYYRNKLERSCLAKISTATKVGQTAVEILRFADEEGAELIIVACNERKGLDRLISGSVSEDVRKHAKVPVLVARGVPMCEAPYTWSDATAAILVCSVLVAGMFILGQLVQNGAFLP